MLELFPEGFEERDRRTGVELAAYTDDAGEERLWAAFGERRRRSEVAERLGGPLARVPPAGAGRPALGRPAVGGAAGRRERGRRSTPAVRSAPARIRRRGSASSCSPSSRAAACSTSAAARACSRSRPPKLGFDPVTARRPRPAGRRGDAPQRGGERRRGRTAVSPTRSRDPLPSADVARREHRARRRSRRSLPRLDAATRRHLRLPRRATRPTCAADRTSGADGSRRLGGRRLSARRSRCPAPMATFSVALPRLQGLARRRAGDPRAPARRRARGARRGGRCRGRQHLLRHARGAAQVAPGRLPRRAHARARLRHRLRREPGRGRASPGCRENVVVVARRSEETPAAVAGDVGAIGCVQADARLDRVRAFVKIQDGCSFSCTSA